MLVWQTCFLTYKTDEYNNKPKHKKAKLDIVKFKLNY